MRQLPQQLVNIRAGEPRSARASDGHGAVTRGDQRRRRRALGSGSSTGRASGTEPLIRVMVEAPTQAETDAVCDALSRAVEEALARPAS